MDIVGAVVVCVNYRLTLKWHFPTAIENGVDTNLYLTEELSIDVQRIGMSGFSSRRTTAFTAPLMLQDELH